MWYNTISTPRQRVLIVSFADKIKVIAYKNSEFKKGLVV